MSEARNLPAKVQITTGAAVAALVPQTLEEAYRLSQALAASGMAPRGIDKPEQILVAIMAGAELGLAPFQSLQSFAVINGKPNIWGDGMLAVVRARGVKVKEWFDNDDEPTKAFCHVTRPDTGEEIERTFSLGDARKANLIGKTGPWQTNQKRMLQMRARAFAIRDGCADMLRGIQIREEVEDYSHVRDVTPKPSGLRERLAGPAGGEGFTAAHAERTADDPVDFAEHAEEIAEAEFEASPQADDLAGTADVAEAALEEMVDEIVADLAPAVADDFDAMDWAGSFTRGLASLTTVAEVSEAWSKAKASGNVVKLRAKSEEAAKQLTDAVNERVAEIKAAG